MNKRSDIEGSRFKDLLLNERGFHQLFCDLERSGNLSLYHNENFAEDPIFNHFIIEDALLDSRTYPEQEVVHSIFHEINQVRGKSNSKGSLFMEDFWQNGPRFEKTAIEEGFRISDKMEILSKPVDKPVRGDNAETRFEKTRKPIASLTKDVRSWNRVFMDSFSIPKSWEDELLRREGICLDNPDVSFIIAQVNSDSESSFNAGCLLSFVRPSHCCGIYCVGTIPRWRGRGVALEMLEFAHGLATKFGCKMLTLQTLTSDNVSPMYKKIGYTADFERDILFP